jgi:hypothetical protein
MLDAGTRSRPTFTGGVASKGAGKARPAQLQRRHCTCRSGGMHNYLERIELTPFDAG